MRKLKRDLEAAQAKVHTLTSQLSTNVSNMSLLWFGLTFCCFVLWNGFQKRVTRDLCLNDSFILHVIIIINILLLWLFWIKLIFIAEISWNRRKWGLQGCLKVFWSVYFFCRQFMETATTDLSFYFEIFLNIKMWCNHDTSGINDGFVSECE